MKILMVILLSAVFPGSAHTAQREKTARIRGQFLSIRVNLRASAVLIFSFQCSGSSEVNSFFVAFSLILENPLSERTFCKNFEYPT